MQFTVHRDEFLSAVTSVLRATATRVIQPILSNVLISAPTSAGMLALAATDLDFTLKTALNAEITLPGATTLNAKKLSEILAKLPPKTLVTLTIDTTLQTARIKSGSSTFDLRTLPAEEFPELPTLPTANVVEVPLEAFLRAVRQTEFAAAGYETNNVLGGVFVKLSPQSLEMVATDGSRLARRVEALETTLAGDTLSAIIPARTLQEFLKLANAVLNNAKAHQALLAKNQPDSDTALPPDEAEELPVARIALDHGRIYLSAGQLLAVSRLLDGQYPRYEQLIPLNNRIVMESNRVAFMASLERAAVMANERTKIVKLKLENGQLMMAADTPELGQSHDSLPVRYDGEPLEIAFNHEYVLDALKVIESDDVRMETNGVLAPTLFRDSDETTTADNTQGYLCLVMPVQVK